MIQIIESIKNPIRFFAHILKLGFGYAYFLLTCATPAKSYQSLVALFCLTGGKSNDLIHAFLAKLNKPYRIPSPSGVLGNLAGSEISSIVEDIRDNGYHVFKTRLSDDLCAKLLEFSLQQDAELRPSTEEMLRGIGPRPIKMNRLAPLAVRYDYSENACLESKDIQALISDPSLLAIGQSYLGCKPILDIVTLWWHTTFSNQPDKHAAQYYHFDMDRIKWLKFFFYVTDVNPDNGPHCFVAKSHRTGGIPKSLLKKGYERLTDAEVEDHFLDKRDFIEFAAPKGTIIAEDTRGLHKGKHLTSGDRLIFQIEFCDSLFGAAYQKARFPRDIIPELNIARTKYGRVYSKID